MTIEEVLVLKIMDSLVELTASILSIYCFLRVYNKFENNKSKLVAYEILMFGIFSVAPIAQFLDGLFYIGSPPSLGLWSVQYGYAFILLSISIANIALFYLSIELFINVGPQQPKWVSLFKIFYSMLLLILSVIGFILKLTNQDVTIIIGLYMLLAIILNGILGRNAQKILKHIGETDAREPLLYISRFAYALLLVYIFFILDSFYSTYSIWGFFGWATYFICVYLAYKGFIAPMKRNI